MSAPRSNPYGSGLGGYGQGGSFQGQSTDITGYPGNYGGARFPNMGIGNNYRLGTQFRPQMSTPYGQDNRVMDLNSLLSTLRGNAGGQGGQFNGQGMTQMPQGNPMARPTSPIGGGTAAPYPMMTDLSGGLGGASSLGSAQPYSQFGPPPPPSPSTPAPTSDPNNPLSFDYWYRRAGRI